MRISSSNLSAPPRSSFHVQRLAHLQLTMSDTEVVVNKNKIHRKEKRQFVSHFKKKHHLIETISMGHG